MKQLTSKLISAAMLMTLLVFSVSIPVSALESESTIGDTPSETQSAAKAKQEAAKARAEQKKAQQEARAQVAAAKAEAKSDGKPGRTAEQKQKICNARKNNINTRVKGLVTSSQRAQRNIDRILTKAQQYHDNKNIQLDNYESLLDSAKAAQSKSAASVEDLAAAAPEVDCSNGHAHDDVIVFQTQAKTTRADIKAYRESVKALLKALQTAKSEGAQQ